MGVTKQQQANSLRTILTALVGNFFVTILKFIGWLVTSSPSMLAEALHSFADVMNQGLLFAGIHNSKRKATPEHPWGMGPIQYLFNLLSAIGVFTLGCVLTIWHAIHDYFNPTPISSWWWLSICILAVAFVVEGYTCIVALKEIYARKGRKKFLTYLKNTDDPALIAVLLEDGAAMLGIFLAMTGVIVSKVTANPLADVVAAVVIGLMMGGIAWFLGITNAKLLLVRLFLRRDKRSTKSLFSRYHQWIKLVS